LATTLRLGWPPANSLGPFTIPAVGQFCGFAMNHVNPQRDTVSRPRSTLKWPRDTSMDFPLFELFLSNPVSLPMPLDRCASLVSVPASCLTLCDTAHVGGRGYSGVAAQLADQLPLVTFSGKYSLLCICGNPIDRWPEGGGSIRSTTYPAGRRFSKCRRHHRLNTPKSLTSDHHAGCLLRQYPLFGSPALRIRLRKENRQEIKSATERSGIRSDRADDPTQPPVLYQV
jgi:hypothetical protein